MPTSNVVRYGTHSFAKVHDTGSDWFAPGKHAKVVPWWHHPKHGYQGRHQLGDPRLKLHMRLPDIPLGQYVALPYGVHSVMIRPYIDAGGQEIQYCDCGDACTCEYHHSHCPLYPNKRLTASLPKSNWSTWTSIGLL